MSGYKSPITMLHRDIECRAQDAIEQAVGFVVDADELKKALAYDRQQYDAGYRDGLIAAMERGYNVGGYIPINDDDLDPI